MARNPIPGRLNRESNPVPGTLAGFNPQFYDADGHAVDVDVNNPYPVGNYIKQGSLWIPVSSDNPMPTKDNEIKQKIEELNQKVDEIVNGNAPANVRLTGSYVEEIIPRGIRQTSSGIQYVEAPKSSKGAIFIFRIYGGTGTFLENQGIRPRVLSETILRNNESIDYDVYGDYVKNFNSSGNYLIVFYPNQIDVSPFSTNRQKGIKYVRTFPHSGYRVVVDIAGSFDSGEGIDYDVQVLWLF